jgi:hypothetical protein
VACAATKTADTSIMTDSLTRKTPWKWGNQRNQELTRDPKSISVVRAFNLLYNHSIAIEFCLDLISHMAASMNHKHFELGFRICMIGQRVRNQSILEAASILNMTVSVGASVLPCSISVSPRKSQGHHCIRN